MFGTLGLSYARVLLITFCFHFNYFRQRSRACYNVHRIDSQDSIEEWQVVEIISFPSFHGKINVDNMLHNLKKGYIISDVTECNILYINTYISPWNEANYSSDEKHQSLNTSQRYDQNCNPSDKQTCNFHNYKIK